MKMSFAVLASELLRLFPVYFGHVQMMRADFTQLVLLWAPGCVLTMIVFQICGLRSFAWRISAPVLGVVSAFVGLVFASSYYYCPVCQTPPEFPAWCEVGVSGLPIPSRYRIYDVSEIGPETEYTDSCDEWTEKRSNVQLNTATAANFFIGAVASPLILALPVNLWRRRLPQN